MSMWDLQTQQEPCVTKAQHNADKHFLLRIPSSTSNQKEIGQGITSEISLLRLIDIQFAGI